MPSSSSSVRREKPTTSATTLVKGDEPRIVDGPFVETKEQLLGFYVIECQNLDEAIEWAKRVPNPHGEGQESEIEIRQFFEMEDFAPSDAVDRAKELGKELAKTKKQSQ